MFHCAPQQLKLSWEMTTKWNSCFSFFMTGIALGFGRFFSVILLLHDLWFWFDMSCHAVPLCLIAIHWKCNFDQMQTNVIEQTKWVNSLHFRTFKLKIVLQLYKYCRYLLLAPFMCNFLAQKKSQSQFFTFYYFLNVLIC